MASDPLSTLHGVSLGMNREIESVTKSKKNGANCHIFFHSLFGASFFFFLLWAFLVMLTFECVMLKV